MSLDPHTVKSVVYRRVRPSPPSRWSDYQHTLLGACWAMRPCPSPPIVSIAEPALIVNMHYICYSIVLYNTGRRYMQEKARPCLEISEFLIIGRVKSWKLRTCQETVHTDIGPPSVEETWGITIAFPAGKELNVERCTWGEQCVQLPWVTADTHI